MSVKRMSSSEAIWLALLKTRQDLARGISFSKFLRIYLVAVVAEGILVPYQYLIRNDLIDALLSLDLHRLLNSAYVPMAIWAIATAIALLCPIYYTVVRMRFVLFHCLVFGERDLEAGWRPYGRETVQMGIVSALSWLVVVACLIVQSLVLAAGGLSVFTLKTDDGKFDPGVFLFMYFSSLLVAFVLGSFVAVIKVILHDFILPHMALEHLSFWRALAACRRNLVAERETFLWYFVLRVTATLILWALLTAIATGLGHIVLGFLSSASAGLDLLLANDLASFPGLKFVSDFVFGLIGVLAGVLLALAFGGPLGVWTRNYSLIFYASRYRQLGDRLPVSQEIFAKTKDKSPQAFKRSG
ncbi:MAG TPA: hypothetical protein VK716_01580 [Terracidiphilus sp.]|jgi:hypothetical protein|nr:hypothetical protein [Terracidiphilus sp.]